MGGRKKGLSRKPTCFKASKYSIHGTFYSTGWTYPGGEEITHIPLMDFARKMFLSRAQVYTLIKKKILFVTRYKGRFLVALKPKYSEMNGEELLQVARWL